MHRTASCAVLLALACHAGATMAQGCTTMPSTLPDVADVVDGNLRYEKWSDYCYGGPQLVWPEWKLQNNWSLGWRWLARRFDLYRPTTDSSPPRQRKLVVWVHPVGQTENINGGSDLDLHMLKPLLRAGYTVMSIESRHPADSLVTDESIAAFAANDTRDPPPHQPEVVPADDIATAVRWAKFRKQTLDFAEAEVVLVGQSRGSLALYNGLLDIPGDPNASDWRSKGSAVKGVYLYQAQTTFDRAEVASFIKPDDPQNDRLYQTWFNEDFPPVQNDPPVSAIALAATAPVIPVHMGYEEGLELGPDGKTPAPQCYQSGNKNRAWLDMRTDLPACNEPIFDIHDANYSQPFANLYRPRDPSKFSRCLGLGSNMAKGYGDLVSFVAAATGTAPFTFTPTCKAAP